MPSNNKIIYVWYSSKTHITGKNLASKLSELTEDTEYCIECGKNPQRRPYHAIICWGSDSGQSARAYQTELEANYDTIFINSPKSLADSKNKLKTLQILSDANLPVPNFCEGSEVNRELEHDDIEMPLIGRTEKHQQGKGFILCLCNRDIRTAFNKNICDYFLEYIPNHAEYRIHIFDGEVIRFGKKLGKEDCNTVIRNHQNGWVYHNYDLSERIPNGLKKLAKKSVKALGLTFGAVDLIVSDSRENFILEVNSGPGLIEQGIEDYSKQILEYIEDNSP